MRLIKILLLLIISYVSTGQGRPSYPPVSKTTGYYRYGYIAADSGFIYNSRDTNWIPAYPTEILWQHAGVDTLLWLWDGARWKVNSGGGSSSSSGFNALFKAVVGTTTDGLVGPVQGQTDYIPTIVDPLLLNKTLFVVVRNNINQHDFGSFADYSFDVSTGTISFVDTFINGETILVYYGLLGGGGSGDTSSGAPLWTNIIGKPETIEDLASIVFSEDDIIQLKSGNLINRTPAQFKVDLALTKTDVGLSNLSNNLQLIQSNNLSDLLSVPTARSNLGLGGLAVLNSISTTDITSGVLNPDRLAPGTALQILRRNGTNDALEFATYTIGSGSGDMVAANNLSELTDVPIARGNLGLGALAILSTINAATHITAGTLAADRLGSGSALQLVRRNSGNTALEYFTFTGMTGSNNLSELTNNTIARTNLGLGSLATQNGTFSGTHSGTSSGTNTGDQDLSTYITSPFSGFGTLTGSPNFTWTYNARTDKNKQFIISVNSTLTISGDASGDEGFLVVTQNGVGGFDLEVPSGDLLQDGIAVVGDPSSIDLEDAPGSINVLFYKKFGSIRLWSKGYYK